MTSEAEIGSNVAYAYLALLLSLLCIDREVRARVDLLGQSSIVGKVVSVVEELLRLRRQVDQIGDENRENDIERMEAVLSALGSDRSHI